MENASTSFKYREAADRVWEMAKEYERNGHRELSKAMKELAGQLHDLARMKAEQENEKGG
jgi:HD superfamily phosphohydrolase YqeK